MGFYARIVGLGFPKSYPGKVLLVTFLGAQAPLLAVALYLLLGSSAGLREALPALALLAAVTLAGMAATLLVLRALLAALGLAIAALEAYLENNRFKPINDTHGHQAGDACIRHVAHVMRTNVREGDWLARWGGDEFVLALWDASVFASPEAVLGRINKALRQSPARLPDGEELVLSVSVGARRYAGEDDVRELLAKADAAMYEAKREGRAWVLAE